MLKATGKCFFRCLRVMSIALRHDSIILEYRSFEVTEFKKFQKIEILNTLIITNNDEMSQKISQ